MGSPGAGRANPSIPRLIDNRPVPGESGSVMVGTSKRSSFDFRIRGMDCSEEVAALERAVGPVVGGAENLRFDVLRGRMLVLDPAAADSPEAVREAVARTGMRAEAWRDEVEGVGTESFWARHGRALLTLASGLLTVAGFAVHALVTGGLLAALGAHETAVPWPARLLYSAAILVAVWHILPRAWAAARHLRPDMNLLMTVAITGAVALGQWLEAASVAVLFALSLVLEGWSVGRARRAVDALLDLSPTVARVRHPDGSEETVPAGEVAPGSTVVVTPGEKIPLDGTVLTGTSAVDQAPITGESLPVAKEPGDEVFAGTINGDGALEVRTTRPAEETTLAHIVRLVEEAQARRSPSERWVERFARVYTPAVMALAAAVMVLPPLALAATGSPADGAAWSEWIYRGLVLLVIGCPCALVISTPVSIVAALASAARHGVLIKGGVFVEEPARLEAIAFDKTGTLTAGAPVVVGVEAFPDDAGTGATGANGEEVDGDGGRAGEAARDAVLALAAALEARSEHPLARAIVEHAAARGVAYEPATRLQALPGRGAEGDVNGRTAWVGSRRYLLDRLEEGKTERSGLFEPSGGEGDLSPAIEAACRRIGGSQKVAGLPVVAGAGHTVIVVGEGTRVRGVIVLADALRPEAPEVIAALRRRGLRHLAMLTGDNEPTARAVAEQAGIDEIRAELLPAGKVTAVEELVARYGRVAMIGDGVNDAPAMARSGLGIAMGAAGTDAAIETADVALMADDLTRLPWLIDHSRRALRIIRQNIGFALGVKAVVFLLATVGLASLWAAIAADMGASLLVIANALRLLRG